MLKHCLYRSYTKGLKIAAHVLPLPRPTLFSGSGAVSELLEAISDLGFRRLLLVTDEGLVRIGMVGKVLEQTQGLGLQVGVFSEVRPNLRSSGRWITCLQRLSVGSHFGVRWRICH